MAAIPMKWYVVYYALSPDEYVSHVFVKAKTKKSAIKEAKKQLGVDEILIDSVDEHSSVLDSTTRDLIFNNID